MKRRQLSFPKVARNIFRNSWGKSGKLLGFAAFATFEVSDEYHGKFRSIPDGRHVRRAYMASGAQHTAGNLMHAARADT